MLLSYICNTGTLRRAYFCVGLASGLMLAVIVLALWQRYRAWQCDRSIAKAITWSATYLSLFGLFCVYDESKRDAVFRVHNKKTVMDLFD